MQIICDDRWSYIRCDIDHLDEYGCVAEVIVRDPGAFDDPASADGDISCLDVGYSERWIFAGAIVRSFYIRGWRKITGAVNGNILWQGKRIKDRWDDIDEYNRETEECSVSEIVDGLVENGDRITAVDGIIDMIAATDGINSKGDDHASGDIAGDGGGTRGAPIEGG